MITCQKKWISLILIFTLTSCSIRPTGGSGGKSANDKHFMTYFRGNNELLYFFKPMRFSSDQVDLEADFAFIKRGDSIIDSVTMNYTVFCRVDLGSQGLKNIYIDSTNIAVGILLFHDDKEKNYRARYSTKLSKGVLSKLSTKAVINLEIGKSHFVLYPNSNFTKKSLLKIAQF